VTNLCLAVPGEVVSIDGDRAEVDFGGVKKTVIVSLIDDLKVGDYVIVHTGYAIEKLRKEEALKTLKLWDAIDEIVNQ